MRLAVHDRRIATCSSAASICSATARRSAMVGSIDLAHWPEQTYQHHVADRFPDAEEHLLPSGQVHRVRAGRLPGHVPSVQGRPRAEGHVHEPDGRRERVAVSEPARVGAVGAGSARGHQRDQRPLRRHGAVRLHAGAVRQERNVPTRATWDVAYRDVDLPQLTDFLETQGLRLGGRATGRNHLEWPLGKWAEKRGGGEVTATRRRASRR